MTEKHSPSILPISGRREIVTPSMSAQASLYPLRVSTIYPGGVNGADILYCCEVDKGGTFYCKADKDGRLIRATEWLCTHLAAHLNIVTAECAAIEDPHSGDTLFGSRQILSPASDFEAAKFLNTPQLGELGQPSEWPGAYLSGLYALDMFLNNPDRGKQNFFLQREGLRQRLFAFDFASARLDNLAGKNFPIASSATVGIGRFLRRKHGFFQRSAFEMIDRIAVIPAETIATFLGSMPKDWMSSEQREGICELWSGKRIGGRLMALRTGIADESLL